MEVVGEQLVDRTFEPTPWEVYGVGKSPRETEGPLGGPGPYPFFGDDLDLSSAEHGHGT